jgi:HEAT repeat protein
MPIKAKDTKQVKQNLIKKLNESVTVDEKRDILDELSKYRDKTTMNAILKFAHDENEYVRGTVVQNLSYFDNVDSKMALRSALKDRSSFVRRFAAESLGILLDEDSVELLIMLLGDKNAIVRIEAIESLGDIGCIRAEMPLIKIMKEDKNALVRGFAAIALGQIESKKAEKVIRHMLLTEKQGHTRLRMYVGLYLMGDEEALSHILEYMKSRYYIHRCAAVNYSSYITDRRNKRKIIEAIEKLKKKEKTIAVNSTIDDYFKENVKPRKK